jgi:potassium/hydrogen antiporter
VDSSSALELARSVLLVAVVILLSGAACSVVARRTGIPDIVLFLLAGIALGPEVGHVVDVPASSALNQVVLLFGASFILFDGGASLRLRVLREVWITLVVLATLGVLITGLITGLAAQWLLGLPLTVALLLGAVLAPTDPATLVPIFRQIRIRERVSQTVVSESALNDATGAICALVLMGVATGTRALELGSATLDLLWEAGAGVLFGGLLGYLAAVLITHERFGFLRDWTPLATLICVIGAYLTADHFSASGFMAVFVAGVMLGNRESFGLRLGASEERQLQEFVELTALIMRMFIFILLGTQMNFGLLGLHVWPAIGVVAVLMLVARPITVFVCAAPDRRARWRLPELILMCWTRETGVIPAALAGILAGAGVPHADVIAAVTFMAVLITILVQATTTRWLARRLGLLEPDPLPGVRAPAQK